MKHNGMLAVASLLSILFVTFHLTSDTVHAKIGTPEAGGSTLVLVPILVVWLYGTLVVTERRSGYIIMLVGSLLALGMPVIHVVGAGGIFRGAIARSSPAFLFVWTLLVLGVTGMFALILSARGLLNLQGGTSGIPQPKHGKRLSHSGSDRRGVGSLETAAQHELDDRPSGEANRVIFTGDLPDQE